jgi:glucose/arabinose dehydrogenase
MWWALAGCLWAGRSGGGEVAAPAPRTVDPADVVVPRGYRVEVVAKNLDFPTGVAFDAHGDPYVVEAGYSYGEVFGTPRLVRVGKDGSTTEIAHGADPPWNGVVFHDDAFYVAAGGEAVGGAILRIDLDGHVRPLVSDLPSTGDHHVDGPVIGPDGWIYFGIGTYTNAGVVGPDDAEFGWLPRYPSAHDVPCEDIVLEGHNFTSPDVLRDPKADVETGAFLPFGTPSTPKQRIPGHVPCNGSVLKVHPDGGPPQLVAWGFRNPFGLAWSPDGQLYVSDNGYDDRGSRPIYGAGDWLWKVVPGAWYGWPDFADGRSVASRRYASKGKRPERLLLRAPGNPPSPAAIFPVHASADGLDFSRSDAFGHAGEAFVALFGDMAPRVGGVRAPVGFDVVRVDPATGAVREFAANRGKFNGPGSWLGTGGFERPIAARFDPSGEALYVVDFGQLLVDAGGVRPIHDSGALWKITREKP